MVDSPNTLTLKHPVTIGEVEYKVLTLRRMKARDALVAEGEDNKIMAGYLMFAAIADVSVEVILDLDMEDLTELGKKVAPLMGKHGAALATTLGTEAAQSPGEM
ncbi:phage tail assembly protein [Paradevosia shaoguanensis]|uniref:phage tail assembly protein n=1 Tax=Paradevosia shaoguanensis TaxID=1335043 RepID=UPI003C739A05